MLTNYTNTNDNVYPTRLTMMSSNTDKAIQYLVNMFYQTAEHTVFWGYETKK